MKNALVIGSAGIAQFITWELVKKGMNLFIVGRSQEHLDVTSQYSSKRITPIQGDISIEKERERIFREIKQHLQDQQLDYMVFAAAIEGPVKPFLKITDAEIELTMTTNFFSASSLAKNLINLNAFSDNARILLISSGLDHRALVGLTSYCCSKAALRMLWEALNLELEYVHKNIHVGITNPGIVDTSMQQRLRESKNNPLAQVFQSFKEAGKLTQPEVSGQFHSWVLLNTNDEEFKNTYWNFDQQDIRDKWQNSKINAC